MDEKVLLAVFFCCVIAVNAREVNTETMLELIQEQLKGVLTSYTNRRVKASDGNPRKLLDYQSPVISNITYAGCDQLYDAGYKKDAVYKIWLTHGARFLPVFCDMKTVGASSKRRGWMTIQRRFNGSEYFKKAWTHYVNGFGFPEKEHWIGLNDLYRLLKQKTNYNVVNMTLRFDITDWDGVHAFVEYDAFDIDKEKNSFRILKLGKPTGTPGVGDPMRNSVGAGFSSSINNRGDGQTGGWWFGNQTDINFNGLYATRYQKMNEGITYLSGWNRVNPLNTAPRYLSMKLQ